MPNIFQGKLVRLRAVEPSDWELHWRWDQDTEAARLSYEIPLPRPVAGYQAWAEAESKRGAVGDVFRFQIETLAGELAGTLNTHNCDLRSGIFSYGVAVAPLHQRKGFASEAIWLVLNFYFNERRYQKCTASAYSMNNASIRLHEHLGFTLEGRLRRMYYTGGEYHDELVYGITQEEFNARHE